LFRACTAKTNGLRKEEGKKRGRRSCSKANAVNQVDSERDRATPSGVGGLEEVKRRANAVVQVE
jgi:hypothetical protein